MDKQGTYDRGVSKEQDITVNDAQSPSERAEQQVRTRAQEIVRNILIEIIESDVKDWVEIHEEVFVAHKGFIMRPDLLLMKFGLIVEVDGDAHYAEEQMKHDPVRDDLCFDLGLLRGPATPTRIRVGNSIRLRTGGNG